MNSVVEISNTFTAWRHLLISFFSICLFTKGRFLFGSSCMQIITLNRCYFRQSILYTPNSFLRGTYKKLFDHMHLHQHTHQYILVPTANTPQSSVGAFVNHIYGHDSYPASTAGGKADKLEACQTVLMLSKSKGFAHHPFSTIGLQTILWPTESHSNWCHGGK